MLEAGDKAHADDSVVDVARMVAIDEALALVVIGVEPARDLLLLVERLDGEITLWVQGPFSAVIIAGPDDGHAFAFLVGPIPCRFYRLFGLLHALWGSVWLFKLWLPTPDYVITLK